MQPLRNLGDYIREQRSTSQISLRQLAVAAGVSNPYLSQIERGLRRPSAEILQQIAKALRISAEALYVQAGMLDERMSGTEVSTAVHTDPRLSERQKQVLLEIYESFRNEGPPPTKAPVKKTAVKKTAVRKPVARKTSAKKAPAKRPAKRTTPTR
ncbi:MAG: helix-turn-helix domain-containing protein [Actinomycetota bacterium]|nr:helix-turn-helix domain-containing protein [Actinomycetota bacterium]